MTKHQKSSGTISRRDLGKMAAVSALGLTLPVASARAASDRDRPESTLERVRRTKKMRIAALVGEPPYFVRDPFTKEWSGACVEMAKDIAGILDVDLEYVDSTYGNSVIQLQTGKVDIALALTATPQRALSIGFTHPTYLHPYGLVAAEHVNVSKWSELNNPDLRIAVDLGSTQEMAARRFAPKAKITAFASRDEVTMALQSKKVDCAVFAALLGLTAVKKNPNIGKFSMLSDPVLGLTSNFAIAKEEDTGWRDFLNVWMDYNRDLGQISSWIMDSLALAGIEPGDVPPDVKF
ncbi:MAG: transporter substrate-binding domain-containing protein [Castellaniella sp.]